MLARRMFGGPVISVGVRAEIPIREEQLMAPVRMFALIFGIVYLLVGILGFVPGVLHSMPVATKVHMSEGMLLGLFPVNAIHSVVHILIGVWGLIAYRTIGSARGYAVGLAVIYLLLAVMGLIPGLKTVFGLIPIYGHDVWLHALTGLIAAYFA